MIKTDSENKNVSNIEPIIDKTDSPDKIYKEMIIDDKKHTINIIANQTSAKNLSNNLDSPPLNDEEILITESRTPVFNKKDDFYENQEVEKTNHVTNINNIDESAFENHSTIQLLNKQEKLTLKINLDVANAEKMPESTFIYGQDLLQNLMFAIDSKNIQQKVAKLKKIDQ